MLIHIVLIDLYPILVKMLKILQSSEIDKIFEKVEVAYTVISDHCVSRTVLCRKFEFSNTLIKSSAQGSNLASFVGNETKV